MSDGAPLPWRKLMAFGLGALQLSPTEFWSMTLPELDAALRWHFGEQTSAMTADELASLMERYPDQRSPMTDG